MNPRTYVQSDAKGRAAYVLGKRVHGGHCWNLTRGRPSLGKALTRRLHNIDHLHELGLRGRSTKRSPETRVKGFGLTEAWLL